MSNPLSPFLCLPNVSVLIIVLCKLQIVCGLLVLAAGPIPEQPQHVIQHGPMPKEPHEHHIIQHPPSSYPQEKLGSSNFTCRSLSVMLHKKDGVLRTLNEHITEIRSKPSITPEEKLKMEILELYQRELKATEKSLVTVLQDLNHTLSSDYGSLEKIKQTCRMRLNDVRNAAVLVEEDFNGIRDLEKEMQLLHPNISLHTHYHVVNEILTEISHAADSLESELQEDVFGDSKKMQGAAFETVVKVKEGVMFHEHPSWILLGELQDSNPKGNDPPDEDIAMLIDSSSNQYILSRPRDVTVPVEDHHFLHDVVNLLLLAFLLGGLCSLLKVSSLIGYIFAGMLLGPVGMNVIGSVVQVETIGEFGVIFIVFLVGVDFSPEKLKKVRQVSVYGGNLLLLTSLLLAVVLGLSLGVHPRQSLFVAACLSLSSTPLAIKFIDGSSALKRSRASAEVGPQRPVSPEDTGPDILSSLMGILVMQDVQLGTLMALMPFFVEGGGRGRGGRGWSRYGYPVELLLQILQLLFGFALLLVVARGITTRVLEKFYRLLGSLFNKTENILLGSIAVCFLFVLVAEMVGASMELGCFLAGLAISSQGHTVVEQVKKLMEPVRDLFVVFFFASIGFHVFPTFLKSEFSMILPLTIIVVFLKTLLAVGVLGVFLGHCRLATWIMAFGLTPVSEFSFVLASRGKRLDIISREVYLVILGITAFSLLLIPVLWRLILLCINMRRTPFHWSLRKLPQAFTNSE